jgi:hypothetical protein
MDGTLLLVGGASLLALPGFTESYLRRRSLQRTPFGFTPTAREASLARRG